MLITKKEELIRELIEFSEASGITVSEITRGDLREYIRREMLTDISEHAIRREFGSFLNFKNAVLEALDDDLPFKEDDREDEVEMSRSLEFEDNYVYNTETDKYVFLTERTLSKNVVFPGETIRSIVKAYSNFSGEPNTINQISLKFGIPRKVLICVLKSLGITHDSAPFTNEEISEKSSDQLVMEALEEKKFSFHQKLIKADWKETQAAARKWHEVEKNIIAPLDEIISEFKPDVPEVEILADDTPAPESWVVGLSDLHFGSLATGEYQYFGQDYNVDIADKIVRDYADKVCEDIINTHGSVQEMYVLLLGDILDSVRGMTDKGTFLESDTKGSLQLEYAFHALDKFLIKMLSVAEKVYVKGVGGNHDHFGDWVLYRLLGERFRDNDRIEFELVYSSRWLPFKIRNSFFVMEHGYSAHFKARLPDKGPGRDSMIQRVLFKDPSLLVGINQRYYIAADKHTLELEERDGFEFIRFSSPVYGSEFADSMALNSRPRQNALTVTDDGVKDLKSYYL